MQARQPDNHGARQAVEQWMREHGSSILRLCFVYLRDYHLAEDAMQETFLRAFRGYARFRGDSSAKTWLSHIAVNVCKDINKSAWIRRVNRAVSLADLPEPATPPLEVDNTLIQSVMALPPRQREVVLLHYYMGLPVTEVADALSLSVPTVYKHMKKAQQALRIELEEWHEQA